MPAYTSFEIGTVSNSNSENLSIVKVDFHFRVIFNKVKDDVQTACVNVKSWTVLNFLRLRKLSIHRLLFCLRR